MPATDADPLVVWHDWNWSGDVRPQIDACRAVGGNCVRLVGAVGAVYTGAITLATYLGWWRQFLDYCRLKGLYAYPTGSLQYWRESAPFGNASTPGSVVHTIVALAGVLNDYLDIVVGFEPWTEPTLSDLGQTGLTPTEAGQLYTAVKLVTALPLSFGDYQTAQQANGFADGIASAFAGYVPYCDYLDFHFYSDTGTPATDIATIVAAYPTKDILIGEFGRALSEQAGRIPRMQRALALGGAAGVRGAIMWQIADCPPLTEAHRFGFVTMTDAPPTNPYGIQFRGPHAPYQTECLSLVKLRPDAADDATTPQFRADFSGSAVGLDSYTPEIGTGFTNSVNGIATNGSGDLTSSAGSANALPNPDVVVRSFGQELDFRFDGTATNDDQSIFVGVAFWTDPNIPSFRYLVRGIPFTNQVNVAWHVDKITGGSFGNFDSFNDGPYTIGTVYTLRVILTEGPPHRLDVYLGPKGGSLTLHRSSTESTTFSPGVLARGPYLGVPNAALFATGYRIPGDPVAPDPPTAAPLGEDAVGRGVVIHWPAALIQSLAGYRLYKDSALVYDGPLARYVDAECAAGETHDYVYTIYNDNALESGLSPALTIAPSNPTGGNPIFTYYGI